MGRPAFIAEIERGFGGLFLFTTTGDGNYDIFQRVDDELGLPENANTVCLMGGCLLEIGHMPEASIVRYSGQEGSIGRLRQRFAAIRDTYNAMHAAKPEKQPAAIDAWHEATARLTPCLLDREQC